MSGHAPGPWIEDQGFIYGPNGVLVCDPRCDPATADSMPEMDANARLIAAAPELLEALQWALEWRQLGSRWNLASDEERKQLDKARAAIAKATGE